MSNTFWLIDTRIIYIICITGTIQKTLIMRKITRRFVTFLVIVMTIDIRNPL